MLTINLPVGALEAAKLFATKPAHILFDAKASCIVATDRMQCFIMPIEASGELESAMLPVAVEGDAISVEGGYAFSEAGMWECGNVADFPDWRTLYDALEPEGGEVAHDVAMLGRLLKAHELLGGLGSTAPIHTGQPVSIVEIGKDRAAQVLWSPLRPTPVKKYEFRT